MQSSVEWAGGTGMVGTNAKGQRIEMDWEDGPSPVQLTLQAVGACSLVDVVIGLKERSFSKVWVDLVGQRRDETPRIFTSVHLVYNVEGDVPQRLVEALVAKSHEKYCTVSNMFNESIKFTTEVNIVSTN